MSFKEDWEEIKLNKVANFKNGKSIDENDRNDKFDVEIFGSNGVIGKTKNALIEDELIIIGRVGAYCGSLQYSNKPVWVTDNAIACSAENENTKYIYYYLKTISIRKMAGGSAQPLINQSILKNIKINLPPKYEQKRIANILYTLDKKIENNNKMNKTLEEMAQVIYKSWFVDFEPFQDGKFVESELGMIPNNIELKPLKDFFSVKTGKKNANIATDDGDYAFFTCSQGMRRTNVYSFDDTAILLAGNGDFNVKWYRGKFEAYQRTYVLIPNVTELFSFLYYSIDYFLDKLILGQRGSVISYLTKGMVEELKIPIMKDENMFNDIIKRLNNINYLIEKNENENRTLKKLRDSLLPKLMSGEIRVPLDDNAKEVN